MSKISVIVPIYNVEPYIHQCVDSIINQTYKDLEIILVDDGSPDNCGKICDEYAAKDSRVKVIHRPNGGLSAARNSGLDVTTGDYIAFVDSDDYIRQDAIQTLFNTLVENDLDIVAANTYRLVGDKATPYGDSGKLTIIERPNIMPLVFDEYGTAQWNRLFKKEIFEGIRYPEGRKYEDSAVSPLTYSRAQRVADIDIPLYYYRKNENSITQKGFNAKARWDCVLSYQDRLAFAEKYYPDCVPVCVSLLLKVTLSCLTAVYAQPKGNKEYYDKCKAIIEKYKNHPGAYEKLNGKYKTYLNNFGKHEWMHKLGAKASLWAKKIKS